MQKNKAGNRLALFWKLRRYIQVDSAIYLHTHAQVYIHINMHIGSFYMHMLRGLTTLQFVALYLITLRQNPIEPEDHTHLSVASRISLFLPPFASSGVTGTCSQASCLHSKHSYPTTPRSKHIKRKNKTNSNQKPPSLFTLD